MEAIDRGADDWSTRCVELWRKLIRQRRFASGVNAINRYSGGMSADDRNDAPGEQIERLLTFHCAPPRIRPTADLAQLVLRRLVPGQHALQQRLVLALVGLAQRDAQPPGLLLQDLQFALRAQVGMVEGPLEERDNRNSQRARHPRLLRRAEDGEQRRAARLQPYLIADQRGHPKRQAAERRDRIEHE